MGKLFLTAFISFTLLSCSNVESEKKEAEIPEVKTEEVDSLFNTAGKMITNAGDSLKKDSAEKK